MNYREFLRGLAPSVYLTALENLASPSKLIRRKLKPTATRPIGIKA